MAAALLTVGLLVFLAHVFSAVFERTRLPDVLPLLLLGLLVGPLGGLIGPESMGKAGGVFTLIALGAILFEGGLGLDLRMLRESLGTGVNLTAGGFVSTMAATGALFVAAGSFTWLEGLMLGAIVGGTSSAVVIPLARLLPLADRTRTALLLESTFTDVACIVVTLALIQAARYDEVRPGLMVGQIIASFTLASVIGFIGALFWSNILDRVRQLQHSIFTTPAFVLILYGVSEILGYSGAISALSFGVALGNVETIRQNVGLLRDLRGFKPGVLSESDRVLFAEVVFLLKTFFFVYIGVSIRLQDWRLVAAGLGLTAALTALRVGVVRLTCSSMPRFDAAMTAVMGPKGLAAAVLAGLPLQHGLGHGEAIQNVTYAVVLFSIIGTSVLTFLIERGKLTRLVHLLFAGNPAGEGSPAPSEPARL